MKNDGRCWIHLPAELAQPTLDVNGVNLVNRYRELVELPLLSIGDNNPIYAQIARLGIAEGSAIAVSNGVATIGPISTDDRLELSLIDLVLILGGEVEAPPVYLRIADIAAICPLGDGVETWATWGTFGESHKPTKYGSLWYRSIAVGETGANMSASQVFSYVRNSVISLEAFKAIQLEFSVIP